MAVLKLAKNKFLISFFQFINCWPGEKIIKIKRLNCFLVDKHGSRSTNSYVWNWPHVKALFRKIENVFRLKLRQKKTKNVFINNTAMYAVKANLGRLCSEDCGRIAEYWDGCDVYVCGQCLETFTSRPKNVSTATW